MPKRTDPTAVSPTSACAGRGCQLAGAEPRQVTRRDFVARSTLAAVAALLVSACGDGVIGGVTGLAGGLGTGGTTPGAGSTFRLSDYPALANVGGIARANAGGSPIALVRNSTTTVSAFSLVCPHQGTTVDITGGSFKCPNHGATFNAAGTWTGGQQTGNLVSLGATLDAALGIITLGAAPSPAPSQPGSPSQPAPGAPGNVALSIRVASYPALASVGGVARVDGGTGIPIGVARTGAATFVAYTLACTHQGTTVQLLGAGWRCPNHGATFDGAGRVTSGPATTNLAQLTATLDAATGTLGISGSAPAGRTGGGDDDDDRDG